MVTNSIIASVVQLRAVCGPADEADPETPRTSPIGRIRARRDLQHLRQVVDQGGGGADSLVALDVASGLEGRAAELRVMVKVRPAWSK